LDCAARLEETPAPSTPALTLEQVQALSARVAAVVSERDRLREEVKCLRLIMAELGNLHQLLDTAPGAMVATAMNNGSARDHRPTAPPTTADIGVCSGYVFMPCMR
jgi:hypothetical protein